MSISQNFPEEGPTLNLNFAGSKVLDPRITFARPSTSGDATYTDANGLIVTAAADEPRFDHRYVNGEIESLGLLVEEQRTNYIVYSEELDDTGWSRRGVGISTNTTTSPSGEITAEKIFDAPGVSGNQHWLRRRATGLSTNSTYTASTYLKFDSTNSNFRHLSLTITDAETGGSSYSAVAISTSGTATVTASQFTNTSAGITTLPNGWYRAHLTFTNVGVTNQLSLRLILLTNSNSSVYDSDGSSGVFVWGAQLEAGAFPTSYIPTSGSTKTRSPDNVTMTGTNFSDWFNSSEGTLYASASILGKNIHTTGVEYPNGICKISDTGSNLSFSRVLYFGGNANPDRVSFGNRDSSSSRTVRDDTFGDIQSNQYYKVCGTYINNDEQVLCLNGGDIKSDLTDVNPPTPNQLLIGTGYNGGIAQAPGGDEMYLNGHISQLTYYPTRLSNTVLQNLTK